MILFLVAAVVIYVVIPGALVAGAIVAVPVGVLSAAVAIAAGGPGVSAGARLTASPRSPVRFGGWALLGLSSVTASAAGAVAVAMLVVTIGAAVSLPTFLPFVPS